MAESIFFFNAEFPKSDLQIQYNLHQFLNDDPHRKGKKQPQNVYGNSESLQIEQCRMCHTSSSQMILQSNSNNNSVVLTQKQACKPKGNPEIKPGNHSSYLMFCKTAMNMCKGQRTAYASRSSLLSRGYVDPKGIQLRPPGFAEGTFTC